MTLPTDTPDWQRLAQAVADRYTEPRRYPIVATLEYLAEHAFWQATNLAGFEGDLAAWQAVVRRAAGPPPAPPVGVLSPVNPPERPAPALPPTARAAPTVAANAPLTVLEDGLLDWLNKDSNTP